MTLNIFSDVHVVDLGVWQDPRCTVGRCFQEMSLCVPAGWLVLYKSEYHRSGK